MKHLISKFIRVLIAGGIAQAPMFAYAQDAYETHRVKQGETLSTILHAKRIVPLYGDSGMVAEARRINPTTVHKNGDFIKVGTVINLPARVPTLAMTPVKAKRDIAATMESATAVASVTPVVAEIPACDMPVAHSDSMKVPSLLFSTVDIEASFNYRAFSGVDRINNSRGKLLSDLAPGLELAWSQNWGDGLKSKIYISADFLKIQSEKQGVPIDNASFVSSAFGLGFSKQFSQRLNGTAAIEFGQTPFYRSNAAGTGLEIIQPVLARAIVGLDVRLLERAPFALDLALKAKYFGTGQFDTQSIESGYGYGAGFNLSQQFAESKFLCGLGYDQRNQKTMNLDLTDQGAGVSCSWAKELK